MVEEWIHIAALTEAALPSTKPRNLLGTNWDSVAQWKDKYDDKEIKQKFKPTNLQVSIWEEIVLRWFPMIDDMLSRKIVWSRACNMGWKRICAENNIGRTTARRKYNYAIDRLVSKVQALYVKKRTGCEY